MRTPTSFAVTFWRSVATVWALFGAVSILRAPQLPEDYAVAAVLLLTGCALLGYEIYLQRRRRIEVVHLRTLIKGVIPVVVALGIGVFLIGAGEPGQAIVPTALGLLGLAASLLDFRASRIRKPATPRKPEPWKCLVADSASVATQFRFHQYFPDEMSGLMISRPWPTLEAAQAHAAQSYLDRFHVQWRPPTEAERAEAPGVVCVLQLTARAVEPEYVLWRRDAAGSTEISRHRGWLPGLTALWAIHLSAPAAYALGRMGQVGSVEIEGPVASSQILRQWLAGQPPAPALEAIVAAHARLLGAGWDAQPILQLALISADLADFLQALNRPLQ